jgi:hypothetical protein
VNNDDHPEEKDEIARAILAYLEEHPDAQDTLEGIVRWWLLEQKISYHSARVRDALAELVRTGFLVESRNDGSGTRYHLNRSTDRDS